VGEGESKGGHEGAAFTIGLLLRRERGKRARNKGIKQG